MKQNVFFTTKLRLSIQVQYGTYDNTSVTERSGILYMLYPTHAADSKINKYKFLQYFTSICLELEKQEYCEYSSRTFPIGIAWTTINEVYQ